VFLFLERPLLTSLDQSAVIYPLLKRFGITEANLGFFVLNNAINNDTTLAALSERIRFDPNTKRLRYIGHVLNLITEAYLFSQDIKSFGEEFKKAGKPERRKL
jgi:hypothetical protein